MCGLFGAVGNIDKQILKNIFIQSRVRGMHAYGISFIDNDSGELVTYKSQHIQFICEMIDKAHTNILIGHCRYSTSGDYNELQNNQPLAINGSMALAFNGVISMKTKEQMEAEFDLELPGDNDGYVLADRIDNTDFIYSDDITVACLYIDNGKLKAFRNKKRPLYVGFTRKDESRECLYFGSTGNILLRSGLQVFSEIEPCKKLVFEHNA